MLIRKKLQVDSMLASLEKKKKLQGDSMLIIKKILVQQKLLLFGKNEVCLKKRNLFEKEPQKEIFIVFSF
jgi:hypothetical protein